MSYALGLLLIAVIVAYEMDRRASHAKFDEEFGAILRERNHFRQQTKELKEKLAKFDRKHARDGRFAGK